MPGNHEVLEDALDHGRLWLADLEPRPAIRAARHPSVAVGHLPEGDLSSPGSVQLAPPLAFGDLGPLILGDDALHLQQKLGLGVVVEWG